MGLAASQCRLLLLTARLSDTEYQAQMISQRRMALALQTEQIAREYSDKKNNKILHYVFDANMSENAKGLKEVLTYQSLMSEGSVFDGGTYRIKTADGRIAVSSLDEIPFIVYGDKNEDGSFTYSFSTTKDLDDFIKWYTVDKTGEKNAKLVDLLSGEKSTNFYRKLYSILASNPNSEEYKKFQEIVLKDGKTTKMNSNGSMYISAANAEQYVVIPAMATNAMYFQNALRTGTLLVEKYNVFDTDNKGWSSFDIINSTLVRDDYYTQDDPAAEAEYTAKTAMIQAQDKYLEMQLKQVETQHQAAQTEYDSVKKVIDKNIERSFKTFG